MKCFCKVYKWLSRFVFNPSAAAMLKNWNLLQWHAFNAFPKWKTDNTSQSALCSQSHHFELSIFTRYANLISMVYSDIDPPNVAEVSNLKTEHSKCAFRYNYMYSQNLDR